MQFKKDYRADETDVSVSGDLVGVLYWDAYDRAYGFRPIPPFGPHVADVAREYGYYPAAQRRTLHSARSILRRVWRDLVAA